jgi:hypothetical protein
MAKWVLKFISGKYQGSEFPLHEKEDYTVGRSNDSSLVLVEDMVSRNHARMYVKDDLPFLEDLGSTNGSFVNGERVSHVQLREGDRILFGTSIIKLVRGEADAASTRPPEPVTQPAQMAATANRTIAMVSPLGPLAHETPPPSEARNSAPAPAAPRPTVGGISGLLEEVSLSDLLQLFSTSRKTGTLRVESGDDRAAMHLREGRVVFAEIAGFSHLPPEKAAYRVMTWTVGVFFLEGAEEREFPEEIEMTTEGMMMESMRLLDEMENIRHNVPDAQTHLALHQPLDPPLRSLTPELLDTLQLILNYQTVQAILDHSLASDLETLQDLVYLLRHQYVMEVPSA